jgi:hypothetical protein
MPRKKEPAWFQFYIEFKNGRTENYGDPQFLKRPKYTKAWKELAQVFQRNEEIYAVGYKWINNNRI